MSSDTLTAPIGEAAALYVLGALPPEERRQFEQRLASGCAVCCAEAEDGAAAMDALALTAPARRPPASLRKRVLDRIAGTAARRQNQDMLSGMVVVRSEDTAWKPSSLPGVEVRTLRGDQTVMLRMRPGAQIPAHSHTSNEQCLVLEGTVMDADGVTARAGDFVFMPAGSRHKPLHTDTGCVLLIAYTA
jgi:anti-sigma factor ChrR (cupin superfamily)